MDGKRVGLSFPSVYSQGLPSGVAVKNPPTMQETWVWSLDQEDLEKETATHSSNLYAVSYNHTRQAENISLVSSDLSNYIIYLKTVFLL